MRRLIVLISLFIGLSLQSNAAYEVTDNCKDAWMFLMDLNFKEAKLSLEKEMQSNPENYYALYLDQTCDAYKLLINSNNAAFEEFFEKHDKRREIMDGKDEDLPYYVSCKAEMDLQVGIFKIIKGSRLSGLRKAYSAYNNTYENLKVYPNFKASLKLDGFFNVAVDNLPPFVKWAVSAFGVTGSATYGFDVLTENYQSQKQIVGLNAESALYIILSAKLNKTPELVCNFVNSLDSNIANTFIHLYFRANILYRTGKNEQALELLNKIDIDKKPEAKIIYSYLKGKVLLRKLDSNAAFYFEQYLNLAKKEEYLKEINYQLALHYLINNQNAKFEKYKEIALTEGVDINERDRETLYDARLDYVPNPSLTRARLLFKGGYLERFEKEIKIFNALENDFLPYELEYDCLKGKYLEATGQHHLAIKHFKKVVEKGSDEDYYFASEAALHLGNIFKSMKQTQKAMEYYKKSLNLYQSNYYEYIEDKASKALRDLEE